MKRIALVAIATIGLLCTTADTFGMFSFSSRIEYFRVPTHQQEPVQVTVYAVDPGSPQAATDSERELQQSRDAVRRIETDLFEVIEAVKELKESLQSLDEYIAERYELIRQTLNHDELTLLLADREKLIGEIKVLLLDLQDTKFQGRALLARLRGFNPRLTNFSFNNISL